MAPISANVSVVLFCSVGFVVAWVGQVGAGFSVGFGACRGSVAIRTASLFVECEVAGEAIA